MAPALLPPGSRNLDARVVMPRRCGRRAEQPIDTANDGAEHHLQHGRFRDLEERIPAATGPAVAAGISDSTTRGFVVGAVALASPGGRQRPGRRFARRRGASSARPQRATRARLALQLGPAGASVRSTRRAQKVAPMGRMASLKSKRGSWHMMASSPPA